MIKKGLILSVQNYSLNTTQEIANIAVSAGCVGIRTDQPIKIEAPVIGLKKNDKEYYITTIRQDLIYVQKWANLVAIDLRKGNADIYLLVSHCHLNATPYVADIRNIEDVKNLIKICKKMNAQMPEYIATTFSILDRKPNIDILKQIKEEFNFKIIAEGGFRNIEDVRKASEIADNICIGTAITGIAENCKKYIEAINE